MSTNIIHLENTEWFTASELADRLDVSKRTVYRKAKRGEVEKRETADGVRYRLASTDGADTDTDTTDDADCHDTSPTPGDTRINRTPQPAEPTTDTDDTDTSPTSVTSPAVSGVAALADRLAEESRQRGRLEAERDRLADDLEEWREFAADAVGEVERLRQLVDDGDRFPDGDC